MAKPRLTSFYRQLIRSIADRFGLSPTLSFDHRPFRTIALSRTYFVLLPTELRTFADFTSYFCRRAKIGYFFVFSALDDLYTRVNLSN